MTEREIPKPREIYRHYKNGSEYEIVAISRFEPTDEMMVTYKPLYFVEGKIKNFTRTLENFSELVKVTRANGAELMVPRFTLL